MVFLEKWLKNHPKFLLHFLIHINVLMVCSDVCLSTGVGSCACSVACCNENLIPFDV